MKMRVQVSAAINDSDRKKLEEMIRKVVEEIENRSGCDFRHLDTIIIPPNFDEELERFGREKGLEPLRSHAVGRPDFFMTAGKTVPFFERGQLRTTVFVHPLILKRIFDDCGENRDSSIEILLSVITHELAHVHDISRRHSVFGSEFMKEREYMCMSQMLAHSADHIWEEYYASESLRLFQFYV